MVEIQLHLKGETRIPFSCPWQTNYGLECGCGGEARGEGGGYEWHTLYNITIYEKRKGNVGLCENAEIM